MNSEAQFIDDAQTLLAAWLDHPRFRVVKTKGGPDFVVDAGKTRLVVEVKPNASSAAIGAAAEQVRRQAAEIGGSSVPVVATSFMGEAGQKLCSAAGVSWFDLSGNADIAGPGLRILIAGRPNRFVRRGRPSSVFAPKSARIARHLLIHPERWFRQQELAREVDLDDGFTSKIVRRLEQDELIERNKKTGAVRVRHPDRMLEAWAEVYSFERHSILRGHVTSRSSEELMARLADALQGTNERYAATGLAAAWLRTEFAAFRLVTFFVGSRPKPDILKRVGFREESKGANVWFVTPNDAGVFDGAADIGGITCVHAVQTYVDLLEHPERAREASAELRARLLRWKA